MVNPDSVRLATYGQRFWGPGEKLIWVHSWYMVQSLFMAGHKYVIVDATNITRKHREAWASENWKTVFHHIDTSKEVCLVRAGAAKDMEICPIIERMAEEYEPLEDDEPRWENIKPHHVDSINTNQR